MRKWWVAAAVTVGVAAVALFSGRAEVRADAGGVPAKPVAGKPVGHGLRLWVSVFYARGGTPGPPPGHGPGGGGGGVDCTDDNSQPGYAAPFASASTSGLTLHINNGTVPSGLGSPAFDSALSNAARTWNSVAGIPGTADLDIATDGTETSPAQDGTSTIGFATIVPRTVLAATWTWVDANNRVIEADLFYNTTQPWAFFPQCPSTTTGNFDVQEIGTHELGHTVGLSHYSDSAAMATMYPSAPPDELRKRTLTIGDAQAFVASYNGP
jgi:Matrixin